MITALACYLAGALAGIGLMLIASECFPAQDPSGSIEPE